MSSSTARSARSRCRFSRSTRVSWPSGKEPTSCCRLSSLSRTSSDLRSCSTIAAWRSLAATAWGLSCSTVTSRSIARFYAIRLYTEARGSGVPGSQIYSLPKMTSVARIFGPAKPLLLRVGDRQPELQTLVVPQRQGLRLVVDLPLHRSLPPTRGTTTQSTLYHVLLILGRAPGVDTCLCTQPSGKQGLRNWLHRG